MDRPYSPKDFYKYHKTSPVLESPGKEEKETALGSSRQEIGADLESARKESPEQRQLENSCRWPMPQEGY